MSIETEKQSGFISRRNNIDGGINMKNSLLAHLYPYIKGSQEDVATYSLQYLLSQSDKLNVAFTKMVAEKMDVELENKMQYLCQVTGESEEMERPDMVGVDSKNNEIVLFEMKFYASLTHNQPNTYLKRLYKNKGLLFICPETRKTSLWAKLKELCDDKNLHEVNNFCVETNGIKLAITTWKEIIDKLKDIASSEDNVFISDIFQLEGYCNKMDSDAFIPFTADDLSAKAAIKEERYYAVVDEVVELLKSENTRKCLKGGNSNAYRTGYSTRIIVDNYNLELLYDRNMWKNPETVETPFWVAVSDEKRQQTEKILNKIMSYPERKWDNSVWNWTYLALEAPQNSTKAEVCENLKAQILKYVDEIGEMII